MFMPEIVSDAELDCLRNGLFFVFCAKNIKRLKKTSPADTRFLSPAMPPKRNLQALFSVDPGLSYRF